MARSSKKKDEEFEKFLAETDAYAEDWGNKYYNSSNNKKSSNTSSGFNDFMSSVNSYTDNSSNKYSSSIKKQSFEDFYNETNNYAASWAEEEAKRQAKKQKEEQDERIKQIEAYYSNHKDSLKAYDRKKDLTYNWYASSEYDYGAVPEQNEQGYFKMKDDFGNIYWEDAVNKKIYNDEGELVQDNSNNYSFSFSANGYNNPNEYVFAENAKSVINTKALPETDRAGLITINPEEYKFLYSGTIKETKKEYYDYDAEIERDDFAGNTSILINNHADDGWIIDNGRYYKPLNGGSYENPITKEEVYVSDPEKDPRIKIVDGQQYVLVFDEIPRSFSDTKGKTRYDEDDKSYYDEQFSIYNQAIQEGKWTTANNALQKINNYYFGHSYDDGLHPILNAFGYDYNEETRNEFQDIFETNVEKLNAINSAIENTSDTDTLAELRQEKQKLEFENQLISYNRITYIYSTNKKTEKLDAIMSGSYLDFEKLKEVYGDTFEEFDDGYQFGDIFGTAKNILNDGLQTVGYTGEMINNFFSAQSNMLFNDLDDGEFKDVWAPAITDVLTYLIPYVSQARIMINYAEPASVVGSFITQEESVTVDSKDGKPRIASGWNFLGAVGNIAANYLSDKIFSSIRNQASGKIGNSKFLEFERQWYSNTARRILTNMGIRGSGEGIEEFVQTYAEYMQNMDEDMSSEFWTQHWKEAWKSALIAFVTASGASGVTSTYGTFKYGEAAGWYNAAGDYIGPGAEKIGKGKQYSSVRDYFKAVQNGKERFTDTQYYKDIKNKNLSGAENVRLYDLITKLYANDETQVNEEITDKSDSNVYSVNEAKDYEKINYSSYDNSEVNIKSDEGSYVEIVQELQNGNAITILNDTAIKQNTDIKLNNDTSTRLSNAMINDNIKAVIVPSSEMETYLKNINDKLKVYVADPKSDTFLDDVREYVTSTKDNITTKKSTDFIPSSYKFTPDEMTQINQMVIDSIKRGNFGDSLKNEVNNEGTNIKYDNTLTVSDITDSDVNTIINNVKNKFLEAINDNKITEATAKKEFKELSKKLSDYSQKTKNDRYYIKDTKNNIVTFAKKGDNYYEAVDTLPRQSADLNVFANVKTDGNIINGNLNTKANFTKRQMNNVNNLIDKLKLKGNFITQDSTYKDIASLVKQNKDMSGEILQALGADGIIEGKNKVRLYTAFDNLDNANPKGAIENTTKYLAETIKYDVITIKAQHEAPKIVSKPIKESTVNSTSTDIKTEDYAYNPDDTTELNNIEAEKTIDDIFKNIEITGKKFNIDTNELKTIARKVLFDRYAHITNIAKSKDDYNVRAALSELAAVANDAQTMIKGAQIIDNEVVGKSLDQIYRDAKFTKKEKALFDKYIMLELNIERENAGVDKIFENVTAKQSRKAADSILKQHPKFKEVANDLQRYNNNLLDMLVKGGLITEETSTKLKNRYKYYMPIYSSDLKTFTDLESDKYIKNMKVDNTIKDVTKTGKQVQDLRTSLENKTYNILSAIAKNKLATEMANSGNYESDGKSEMMFYRDGKLDKFRTSSKIIADVNDNTLQHYADVISQIPVLKQLVDMSNLSYRFILDPVYQLKNIVIDFTDSQLFYSKDRKNFAKNYMRAIIAVANNSEVFNEFKEIGLGEWGTGIKAPRVTYDADGNVQVKQNKFQRIYANLEAMPKLAEYLSLKDKYMKQARLDYEAGKYNNLNAVVLKNEDGSIKHLYHGTDAFGFDEFDSRYNDKTRSYGKTNKLVAFFSDSKENAQTYAKDTNNVYDVHLIMKKPLIVDCKGETWQNIDSKSNPFGHTKTDDIINSAINSGKYDGVIFNNIQDRGPKFHGKLESKVTNDYVVFDNSQIIQAKNYNNNMSFKDIENQIKLQAKVDAEDVNLNFNMGGTGSKALSKLGFKFLNAGVLGLDKFVTHVTENAKTPKGMGSLLLEFSVVGATTAIANAILNGDDEDYDKLPYYYKNNYYMIKIADGKYFRIPKGRVQTLANVLFEYSTGIRTEDDFKTTLESIQSAFDLAVLPPALENASPISAWSQLIGNKDAFGNEIYSEKYDSTSTKIKKGAYHILSNYFGRYGRIVKDATDGDGTTDIFNEFDYYKDTTKANRHYSTALDLVDYYQNKDNVKTLDDKAMKKYIDTQNYALRTINSEINQGKRAGKTTSDLAPLYAARDDLINMMINNYKDFTKVVDDDGNTWYYFDDQIFMYNEKTQKFVKKIQK